MAASGRTATVSDPAGFGQERKFDNLAQSGQPSAA